MIQQDFLEYDPSIAEEFGYEITSQISFLGVPLYDAHNSSADQICLQPAGFVADSAFLLLYEESA